MKLGMNHPMGPLELADLIGLDTCLAIMNSLYEGFGLPAAEAMACGTPVVATRTGALPEVVGEDGAGILVPPRDPPELARAILRILGNGKDRKKMGAAGRRRVEELFTWRKVAERTAEVYKELIKERVSGVVGMGVDKLIERRMF